MNLKHVLDGLTYVPRGNGQNCRELVNFREAYSRQGMPRQGFMSSSVPRCTVVYLSFGDQMADNTEATLRMRHNAYDDKLGLRWHLPPQPRYLTLTVSLTEEHVLLYGWSILACTSVRGAVQSRDIRSHCSVLSEECSIQCVPIFSPISASLLTHKVLRIHVGIHHSIHQTAHSRNARGNVHPRSTGLIPYWTPSAMQTNQYYQASLSVS